MPWRLLFGSGAVSVCIGCLLPAASPLRREAVHTCLCHGAGLLALSLAAVQPVQAKAGQQCNVQMVHAAAAAQGAISVPDTSQDMSYRPAGLTADSETPDAGTSAQSDCTNANEDSSSSQGCTSPAQRGKLCLSEEATAIKVCCASFTSAGAAGIASALRSP